MGLFKTLFKAIMDAAQFQPDFSKSEYDNWLEFLSRGGTTKEWNETKKLNNWKWDESPRVPNMKSRRISVARHEAFERKFRPAFNNYYASAQQLKSDWSKMYHSKDYGGKRADRFERDCLVNIIAYKVMAEIEDEFGEDHLTEVEGFKRLAMLYEKQGKFEESASICKEAIKMGIDQSGRMLSMIKKAGRTPTPEELSLLEN